MFNGGADVLDSQRLMLQIRRGYIALETSVEVPIEESSHESELLEKCLFQGTYSAKQAPLILMVSNW